MYQDLAPNQTIQIILPLIDIGELYNHKGTLDV